jgi:hypothetical protein
VETRALRPTLQTPSSLLSLCTTESVCAQVIQPTGSEIGNNLQAVIQQPSILKSAPMTAVCMNDGRFRFHLDY